MPNRTPQPLPLFPILAVVALVVLALGLFKYAYQHGGLNTGSIQGVSFGNLHLLPALSPSRLAKINPKPVNLPALSHNATFGTAGGFFNLTIFTDPACAPCREQVKNITSKFPTEDTVFVHKYWPSSKGQTTSGLALMLAHQNGVVKKLYAALARNPSLNSADELLVLLSNSGLSLSRQRQQLITDQAALSGMLEADMALAQNLNLGPAPQFFINGYFINGTVLKIEKIALYQQRLKEGAPLLQAADYWLNPGR